jgi:hypothetical protein
MTRSVRELLVAGLIVLGAGASPAVAQTGALVGAVPDVPANLEVPAGFVVYSKGQATGTQNYVCLPAAAGGVVWRFVSPTATLFVPILGFQAQLASHFLSPNPDEGGVARATWQHSVDSSRVWARALPEHVSTDPLFVEAGAIPWLLLDVVGTEAGPDGGTFLSQAAYIHRLNTSGGIAPATGCSQATDIGAVKLVPYTADYFFYKPRRPR